MRSLVSAVRPSYRIQRVLAKGSLRRSSLFDVKRLDNRHPIKDSSEETRTVARKMTDRFSIVVSKKVGKTAVLRNRIKRRLKEGLRLALKERDEAKKETIEGLEGTAAKISYDYVIIGKKAAEMAEFEVIKKQLSGILSPL